mgnify:CR=1 FL=1
MTYTLTQARGLLSAAELNLFDHSRATPIKSLTPARLRAKVQRARALRDKYRDLYRRQTVATRQAPAARRSAVGGDNERTQRKAELFGEVLARFEARLALLEARETGSGAARARTSAGGAQPKARAAKASAGTQGRARRARTVELRTAVQQALDAKAGDAAAPGPTDARSAKAPSPRAPARQSAAPVPSAPLDIVARAKRRNPLKQRADNLAMHAHDGAQTRRSQGRRDSR